MNLSPIRPALLPLALIVALAACSGNDAGAPVADTGSAPLPGATDTGSERTHQVAFGDDPDEGAIRDDSEAADPVLDERFRGVTERRLFADDHRRSTDERTEFHRG